MMHREPGKQPLVLLAHALGMFSTFLWKNAFLRLADYLARLSDDIDEDVLRVVVTLGMALLFIIVGAVVAALCVLLLRQRIRQRIRPSNADMARAVRRAGWETRARSAWTRGCRSGSTTP